MPLEINGANEATVGPVRDALDAQKKHAILTAISGLTNTANKGIILTGTGAGTFTLSAFALTLLDDADAAAMKATLGVGAGGLVNFTESLHTAAPNASYNAVRLLATGGTTHMDFVISPKGGGSILAHTPDDAATGGNKRGYRAVDLQTSRNAATQVASGANSALVGGYNNTVSGAYSFIAAGANNTVSGNCSAAAGTGATASGTVSFAIGSEVVASGPYSTAEGYLSTTRGIHGCKARAAGRFSVTGDAQTTQYILRAATSDATATELAADGGTGSASTRIVLPNASAFKFTAQAIARDTTTGDVKSWDITGTIKRGANAAATAIVGAVTTTVQAEDTGASAWAISVDADTTNGSLRIKGTGAASSTIHWGVVVRTFELG